MLVDENDELLAKLLCIFSLHGLLCVLVLVE